MVGSVLNEVRDLVGMYVTRDSYRHSRKVRHGSHAVVVMLYL